MRIAIVTPTGHIGSKVTERLLSAKAQVVLLARDLNKVRQYVSMGAEFRLGSLEDAKFLSEATKDADGLLWVTPPNLTSTDVRGFQNACGRCAAEAIRANNILRVVNISSIGAHRAKGAGLVSGLCEVEGLLDAAAKNIVHLRCGFFYENFLMQAKTLREQSCFYMTMDGATRVPMLATRDIAETAAGLLLDESWQGRQVRGLHGPEDLSLNEAARRISHGLGRTIHYVKVSEDVVREFLRSAGASHNFIDLLLEMYRAIGSGSMWPAEERTEATTTPTTLEQFAREEMEPVLREELAGRAV